MTAAQSRELFAPSRYPAELSLVSRNHEVHEKENDNRHDCQDISGHASLGGMHLKLPPDFDPLPNCVSELVENFSKVAAHFAVDIRGGSEKSQVETVDPVVQVVESVVDAKPSSCWS